MYSLVSLACIPLSLDELKIQNFMCVAYQLQISKVLVQKLPYSTKNSEIAAIAPQLYGYTVSVQYTIGV